MALQMGSIFDSRPEELAQSLLREIENQWFERKSARIQASDLAETLVAMANAEGGIVAIGLENGICQGIDTYPKRQNDWRQAGLDYTSPAVRFEVHLPRCLNQHGNPDRLFVAVIPPSEQVHATGRDEVFLRVGDENRKLNFEQRIQLRYDRGDTSFERTPANTYGIPELDSEAVSEYAAICGGPDKRRLLQARDLIGRNGELFTAGHLLFGLKPQQIFPQAYVRVLKYAGLEARTGIDQNLVSDIRCEGTLAAQIDAARQAVGEQLPKQLALGPAGRFERSGIVPEEVWLEALVNAVLHRAYSNFGDHIRLSIFDNRLEVYSPGRFPGIASLDDLTRVQRFSRNPRIARVMAEMSYGQELGEGLRRMVEAMEATGRQQPIVSQSSGGVTVILLGAMVNRRELSMMPTSAQQVFQQLSRQGQAGTGDLMVLTGYSRPVVLRNLRLLESTGLVQRTGNSNKDPRAYWSISTGD